VRVNLGRLQDGGAAVQTLVRHSRQRFFGSHKPASEYLMKFLTTGRSGSKMRIAEVRTEAGKKLQTEELPPASCVIGETE